MEDLTPAMKQYMTIKAKYRDCIVFFRMGDFYETFYEDAKTASKVLDIVLTKRGFKNSESQIPLAGIPYHSLDNYLAKMIRQGHKVVIVEQMEDPKLAKGVVKRDVLKIVTPGTFIEESQAGRSNSYIASVFKGRSLGISFVDLSTGEFTATEMETQDELFNEINKFRPAEIILPATLQSSAMDTEFKRAGFFVTYASDVDFFLDNARDRLHKHFDVLTLDGFGMKDREAAISSSGGLITYLHDTQRSALKHINRLRYYSAQDFLAMDSITIKNLELIRNIRDGSEKGTLLSVIDRTQTPMGIRLLKKMLLTPLVDPKRINDRLTAVEDLMARPFILEELKDLLKNISDLERLMSRISLGSANPRDLVSLQGSIELIPEIRKLLSETEAPLLSRIAEIEEMREIAILIDQAIKDEPSISLAEGNFVREGYSPELDGLRDIAHNAKRLIREIEDREREKTGIKSLKVRYNRVFGYYIDITRANASLVPQHYVRKQTLVNSERFITEELKTLEEEILGAEEKIIAIEQQIFSEIILKIKTVMPDLHKAADSIAYLDVICSFATVSAKNRYSKPIVGQGFKLSLGKSRHPVVETLTDFISNDVHMTEDNRIMIITGPNMAGKSVYMRQVALNVILAQIGCFVPADEPEVGIVDKIFCRTGAIDDISQGQSTFMVEMAETAQILNSATSGSLIILDEIGRGTSTYDGVAIAWSVAEYLATRIKAKTLFATHYHALNELEKKIPGVRNYNIAVQEKDDRIIFLRKILQGGTDKSYGIHVAKLAGMPEEVIEMSKAVQFKLEQDDEISEKIIIETRKTREKDILRKDIEEVKRLIKSKQKTLDDL